MSASSDIRVTELIVYPVKSLGGIALQSAEVKTQGLQYDRRWALANLDGVILTAREFPKMLALSTSFTDAGVRVAEPGGQSVELLHSHDNPKNHAAQTLQIHRSDVVGFEVDRDLSRFFSDYLDEHCRLVRISDAQKRPVQERHGGEPGDTIAFADDCAILLANEASLSDLNAQLDGDSDIPMRQMRPNIVVSTTPAFVEESWQQVTLGSIDFKVAQKCVRCKLATTDPTTCEPHPRQEPLRILAKIRPKQPKGVVFGVHLTPRGTGQIAVGDALSAVAID